MSFVTCPFCDRSFHTPNDPSRKAARCPHCGDSVRLVWDNPDQPTIDDQFEPIEIVEEYDPDVVDGDDDVRPNAGVKGFVLGILAGACCVLVGALAVLAVMNHQRANDPAVVPAAGQVAQSSPVQPASSQTVEQPVASKTTPPQQAVAPEQAVSSSPVPPVKTPESTEPAKVAAAPAPATVPSQPGSAEPMPKESVPAQPPTKDPVPVQPAPQPVPQPAPQPAPFVQAIPVIKKADPANALQYKFEPNRDYPFKFSIETNLGNGLSVTEGTVSYRVSKLPPPPLVENKREGSGSAFVVSADGYLVTCAHVVDKARTIEVVIGGKTYFASIVASDVAHDVALIRIDAQNLTPVAIAVGNKPQLGQTVKALGFPLSDVLGQNLKVSSGTISGLNLQDGIQTLQIDAAINPGNSGGPVVNEQGEVIGVASAKLSGIAVSTVGFARPIDDINALLSGAKVQPMTLEKPEKLDGPALAAKLSPSVAFVRVRSGGTGTRIVLDYEGRYKTSNRPAPGQFPVFDFNVALPSNGTGMLVIDEFGTVLNVTGEVQLPMTLGPIAHLAMIPLNPSGQGAWGTSEPTSISRSERDPNSPAGRFRPPIPFFGSPFQQEKVTVIPAHETTSFKLGELVANTRTVHRQYDLHTTDSAESPYLALKGTGDWRFDTKDSRLLGAELKYELARHSDGNTIRLPFVLKIDSVEPEVIAAERKAEADRMEEHRRQQSQKAADDLDLVAKPKIAKLKQRFAPPSSVLVSSTQMAPDGRRCYVAGNDGPILVYEAGQRDPIGKLEGIEGGADKIVVSKDGKRVAARSHKNTLVWDAESFAKIVQPELKLRPSVLAFSPDGRRFLLQALTGVFEVWDLEAKQKLPDLPNRGRQGFSHAIAVDFSADGSELFETDGKKLRRFNITTGEEVQSVSLEKDDALREPALLSLEGGIGVFQKGSRGFVSVNLSTPADQHLLPFRMPSQAGEVSLSRDGKRIAFSDQNKNVVVWDIEAKQLIETWQVDTISSKAVSLSADGKLLLTCGYHKVLQLWELP